MKPKHGCNHPKTENNGEDLQFSRTAYATTNDLNVRREQGDEATQDSGVCVCVCVSVRVCVYSHVYVCVQMPPTEN